MYNTPRAATCECATDVKLWTIDRSTYRQVQTHFKAARSEKYVKFISEVEIEGGGKKGKLGDCLSKTDLEHMADAMEEEAFAAGAVIIRQGEAGDYFYIIESGTVSVHIDKSTKPDAGTRRATAIKKDTQINTLSAGAFFGQKALLSEDTRNASIVAIEPTLCLTLGREDFVTMLGSVSELLEGGGKKEEVAGPTVLRKDEGIALADLNILKTLGHGAFGRVKLVEHKTKGETYALKCQGKKAIVDNCLQDHIMMEKTILMVLDHPFILKLYSALQDSRYIYFVLEILLGGELFTWLRKQGRFEEPGSKFYAAQVVLGFQHMHSKKIAYRDLKPENLVLDSQGYLKIVDLGLAKIVDGKTWTLCGTPDYLAPEIILNEGHDKAVDYWALGVLIYELVAGIPPFYADDPMEVYEKILSSNMTFPQHFTKNLCDIVRKLLKLCQSKRLGNGKGGCTGIIKHKWFSGFDWEGLLNYGLSSPITVKVASAKDASNFDNYEDEDDNSPECLDWEPDLS
jgi:CRP-like cAMP-binding protein